MGATVVEWPDQGTLTENSSKLIERTTMRLLQFEERFGMTSEAMEQRAATGELDETREIASWLMALETLRLLERGR